MQLPLQITIKDIPHSAYLTNHIKTKAEKLDKFFDHIVACRIVIDMTQKNQHSGKLYSARIDITVPKDELVINHVNNENIYIAIRDAFNVAKRQLQNHAKRIRGDVKTHETYERNED